MTLVTNTVRWQLQRQLISIISADSQSQSASQPLLGNSHYALATGTSSSSPSSSSSSSAASIRRLMHRQAACEAANWADKSALVCACSCMFGIPRPETETETDAETEREIEIEIDFNSDSFHFISFRFVSFGFFCLAEIRRELARLLFFPLPFSTPLSSHWHNFWLSVVPLHSPSLPSFPPLSVCAITAFITFSLAF